MAAAGIVVAQEVQVETAPNSVWLDFNRRASERWSPDGLPVWIESVDATLSRIGDGESATIYRLRLRGMRQLEKEMQLRLYFEDTPNGAPVVSGYSETGTIKFQTAPLGQGLNLPTSEGVIFSTGGMDMIEVQVPGDGTNVRGAFLTILKAQEVRRSLDFAPNFEVIDVFGLPAKAKLADDDHVLYGRVKAPLDQETMRLSHDDEPTGTWDFNLGAVPLLVSVSFEVLNADSQAPLQVMLNDRPLGSPEVQWPDLADPGYIGLVRPLEAGMRFRYAGWIRVQKMIPGTVFQVGENRLTFQLAADSGPVAIRSVEFQLKHNWKNLDYQITPNTP